MIRTVGIYGAGAVGGWIGVRLAQAGCEVSAVARQTAADSFQWDQRFGAGQDVFDALVRRVDRIDDSYKT